MSLYLYPQGPLAKLHGSRKHIKDKNGACQRLLAKFYFKSSTVNYSMYDSV